MSNKINNFADLEQLLTGRLTAIAEDNLDAAHAFESGLIEHSELAKLSIVGEPEKTEMPDPEMARAAVEMVMGTLFDVFRDTRMEEFAQQLAWGFVNSFHMTARLAEGREDDAAKKLGELARNFDPSEIYAVELEEAQLHCQTLQECREALEVMRDHASACYRVETGRPFQATRGSQVSKSGVTASQIQARDYLAARARERREQFAPEGPMVVVSGGMEWTDHELIWDRLDSIKKRIPEMVLATTGMRKGVDAIASSWAASRQVKLVAFIPDRKHGNRAAFLRNEKMVQLRPVEAIVCEGTGIQANLAQRLRTAGVPLHIFRSAQQRTRQRA